MTIQSETNLPNHFFNAAGQLAHSKLKSPKFDTEFASFFQLNLETILENYKAARMKIATKRLYHRA